MKTTKFFNSKSKPVIKNVLSFILLFVLFFSLAQLITLDAKAAKDWWETAKQGGVEEIGKNAFDVSGEPTDIRNITATIIKAFLGLLGIIFLIIIILAGFKWMTAGGDEEKVKEATSQIKVGVIGLLIILAAYAFTVFVLDKIIGATQNTTEQVDIRRGIPYNT